MVARIKSCRWSRAVSPSLVLISFAYWGGRESPRSSPNLARTQIIAESCEERYFRTHRTRCSIVSLSAPALVRSVFAIFQTLRSIVSLFEISQECPKGLQGRSTPIQRTWGAPSLRDHGVGALPEWLILNGKSWVGGSLELLGLAGLERGGPGIKHPGVHGARSADGDTIVCLPVNRLPMAQSPDGEKRCLRRC